MGVILTFPKKKRTKALNITEFIDSNVQEITSLLLDKTWLYLECVDPHLRDEEKLTMTQVIQTMVVNVFVQICFMSKTSTLTAQEIAEELHGYVMRCIDMNY